MMPWMNFLNDFPPVNNNFLTSDHSSPPALTNMNSFEIMLLFVNKGVTVIQNDLSFSLFSFFFFFFIFQCTHADGVLELK